MLEFKVHESFKHIYAKKVLLDWFIGVCEDRDSTTLGQFAWRVNRGKKQNFGIYLEYPVIKEIITPTCEYGQADSPYITYYNGQIDEYFGLDELLEYHFKNPYEPSFDELKRLGISVACVIDLVVMHKGNIKYAFEIVHSHPTPEWKIEIFKKAYIEAYEISADFILNMVETPSYILCKKIA